jgi:hypothetical protein
MRLAHPRARHGDRHHGPALVISHAHLVASLLQGREQGGVHLASGNATRPDGHVGSVPTGALPPYFNLQSGQGCWRAYDGGTEVTPDVEDDGPFFACPDEMVHDYGATETGVTDGFE